jgi:thioredoxin-related protein
MRSMSQRAPFARRGSAHHSRKEESRLDTLGAASLHHLMRILSIAVLVLSTFAAAQTVYTPVHKFDEKRDAAGDLRATVAEAHRIGKRIILDVGGDWCIYCQQMNDMFQKNPDVAKLRDDHFIMLAVYYGAHNKNVQFLSQYGAIPAIPHFYVLDDNGRLLRSQPAVELREATSYSPDKMRTFLLRWSPHP